jgi:hypothetical protein
MKKTMKWVEDSTHRFTRRPYYTCEELDRECENIVIGYLQQKYGQVVFPLATDDLVVLLEKETSDLDLYADFGLADIEGQTTYLRDARPAVKIAGRLSLEENQNQRLRTALAHEYGHVHFHAFLWFMDAPTVAPSGITRKIRRRQHHYRQSLHNSVSGAPAPGPSFTQKNSPGSCFLNSSAFVHGLPEEDWMEWQAAYAGAAVLMPFSPLLAAIRKFNLSAGPLSPRLPQPSLCPVLTAHLSAHFDVSPQTVSTRLTRMELNC